MSLAREFELSVSNDTELDRGGEWWFAKESLKTLCRSSSLSRNTGPNQLWVADATYLPTREGTLYLAIIKDVFSHRIVGWSMSARQGSELMVKALQMALAKRQGSEGVIHHSDQGSQYTSASFRRVCEAANIVQSMGAVGNCYDNAMAESFFATLERN